MQHSSYSLSSLLNILAVKGTSELNAFRDTSTCTCTGTIKTYQCTVFGSGATIWNGTALMCPSSANEIRLLHSQFQDGITTECDGGNIVGRSIATQNRSYTSQLSISVTSQINGQSVHCIHDALHRTIIGSASIRISEGMV